MAKSLEMFEDGVTAKISHENKSHTVTNHKLNIKILAIME